MAGARNQRPGFDVYLMGIVSMFGLFHGIARTEDLLAALVTAGVAVLLICCLECTECSRREKDDLFRRHEL